MIEHKILLVIDVQNGFITNKETAEVAKKIAKVVEDRVFDVVLLTKFVNRQNSPFIKIMGWDEMCLGSPRTDICTDLAHSPNVWGIVSKSGYSVYPSEIIEALPESLSKRIPEKIYLCGIDTNVCVLQQAVSLFLSGIRPVVLESLCASSSCPDAHKAGILCLEHMVGKDQIYFGDDVSKA